MNLNIENNFIKLFLNQMNILFFLLNLKHYNTEFINQFKESLSLFKNIKFSIEKINNKFESIKYSSKNLNSEIKKNFLAQSQKIKKTSTYLMFSCILRLIKTLFFLALEHSSSFLSL